MGFSQNPVFYEFCKTFIGFMWGFHKFFCIFSGFCRLLGVGVSVFFGGSLIGTFIRYVAVVLLDFF